MSTNGAFDWALVLRLAKRVGVTPDAVYVWKTRHHVPHKFRLKLIAVSSGHLVADDFFRMDERRRRRAKKPAPPMEIEVPQ